MKSKKLFDSIKKKLSFLLVVGIITTVMSVHSFAVGIAATPTNSPVLVNGTYVSFQAYNIDDNNYFKLRDIAKVLSGTGNQFQVGWDNPNNAIALTTGQPYTPVGGELVSTGNSATVAATWSTASVYVNGKQVFLGAFTIGGNNYFKLRDLATALGFSVDWDSSSNTIIITTSQAIPSDGVKMQVQYEEYGDVVVNLSQYVKSVQYQADGFTFGKSYIGQSDSSYIIPYVSFTVDNSNLSYETLTYYIWEDDRSPNSGLYMQYAKMASGNIIQITNKQNSQYNTTSFQDNGFLKVTVDISNIKTLKIVLLPSCKDIQSDNPLSSATQFLSTGKPAETWMVINGVYLK